MPRAPPVALGFMAPLWVQPQLHPASLCSPQVQHACLTRGAPLLHAAVATAALPLQRAWAVSPACLPLGAVFWAPLASLAPPALTVPPTSA